MAYTREEWDWLEAEWAFHLHGRSSFLSAEDFKRLEAWEGEGVPADLLVHAMGAYFARRAKRPRPRSFVKVDHLARDVAKAVKLREAFQRGSAPAAAPAEWDRVAEPLKSDPRARNAFDAWQRIRAQAPSPDDPGFLDHFDAERAARRALVELAEAALGARASALRLELEQRLREAEIQPGSPVWQRAYRHHWELRVCEAWGLPS